MTGQVEGRSEEGSSRGLQTQDRFRLTVDDFKIRDKQKEKENKPMVWIQCDDSPQNSKVMQFGTAEA